jgi:hypothetical protein
MIGLSNPIPSLSNNCSILATLRPVDTERVAAPGVGRSPPGVAGSAPGWRTAQMRIRPLMSR